MFETSGTFKLWVKLACAAPTLAHRTFRTVSMLRIWLLARGQGLERNYMSIHVV